MKSEILFVSLGGIGEDLIAEAMEEKKSIGRERRRLPLRAMALAAAVCLFLMGTLLLALRSGEEGSAPLPMLELGVGEYGMGREAYLLHDIDELFENGRLTVNKTPKTLPVYRNETKLEKGTFGISPSVSEEQMKQKLIETALLFGVSVSGEEISDTAMPKEAQAQMKASMEEASGLTVPDSIFIPSAVFAEKDGIHFEVTYTLAVTVRLDQPIVLPNGLLLASEDLTLLSQAGDRLAEEYGALFGMKEPTFRLSGGDYGIDGERNVTLSVIDRSQTPYALDELIVYGDEEGRLKMLRFFDRSSGQKMGDYPIISEKEAESELLAGRAITSSEPYRAEWEIVRAELVYRTGDHEPYYMPYYRFFVNESGTQVSDYHREKGFDTYAVYYVPAVESEYIADFSVWDGSFNGGSSS